MSPKENISSLLRISLLFIAAKIMKKIIRAKYFEKKIENDWALKRKSKPMER